MIELEDSMTSFIKQLQGRSPNGPELRKFKDQAAAIAGALFRISAWLHKDFKKYSPCTSPQA
jgi:hypothetical protein